MSHTLVTTLNWWKRLLLSCSAPRVASAVVSLQQMPEIFRMMEGSLVSASESPSSLMNIVVTFLEGLVFVNAFLQESLMAPPLVVIVSLFVIGFGFSLSN